jgi:hypothetical protein
MASVGDAVGAGIVASLAQPSGNVTGMTLVATAMGTKRLELLKEVVPNLARVAAIWNGANSGHRLQMRATESVTQSRFWHIPAVCCGATSRLPSEFERTWKCATSQAAQLRGK